VRVGLFQVLAQLENGRIYRRIYYLEDSHVRIEGRFSRQYMAGHTLRRTLLLHGSCIHTSGTSSVIPFHQATVYDPQAGMSSTSHVSPSWIGDIILAS